MYSRSFKKRLFIHFLRHKYVYIATPVVMAILYGCALGIDRVLKDEYQNGYEDGCEEGYEEGYEEGKQDGYSQGYYNGYEDGRHPTVTKCVETNEPCNACYGHAYIFSIGDGRSYKCSKCKGTGHKLFYQTIKY